MSTALAMVFPSYVVVGAVGRPDGRQCIRGEFIEDSRDKRRQPPHKAAGAAIQGLKTGLPAIEVRGELLALSG